MRLKILEALEDKKMIDDTENLIEKIWLLEKNVSYVDVKIINYLDVLDTFQKNVVAIKKLIHLKIYPFLLGPDLSWKFKQHLHSFSRHSDSLWWLQIPHSQLFDIIRIISFRI
jgi:hypothetical protein